MKFLEKPKQEHERLSVQLGELLAARARDLKSKKSGRLIPDEEIKERAEFEREIATEKNS